MLSKKTDSSDPTSLTHYCEKYRAQVEECIRSLLTPKLKKQGLLHLAINHAQDFQQFGDVCRRLQQSTEATLRSEDIQFVAEKVIKRDPSPAFRDAYPELAWAFQKFHAVNALLNAPAEHFKRAYLFQFRELIRPITPRDATAAEQTQRLQAETQQLVSVLKTKVGAYAPNSQFFAAPASSADDAAMRSPPTPRARRQS